MKYLSILMVGVTFLVGGCGEVEFGTPDGNVNISLSVESSNQSEILDEGKPDKEETPNKAPIREVSADKLEKRDKIWYVKGETEPFTGTAIQYRKDGSKSSETPYADGVKHGTEITYWEDGSKSREASYVNGKRHGTYIRFNSNGSKGIETPYVNGQKHGTAIHYRVDGSKMNETPWVDGWRRGTEIDYREDGSKSKETVWENDKVISEKKF